MKKPSYTRGRIKKHVKATEKKKKNRINQNKIKKSTSQKNQEIRTAINICGESHGKVQHKRSRHWQK